MNEINKKVLGLFSRYIFLVIIALNGLIVFYLVFTPLTIYPVYALLNLFFDVSFLSKSIILVGDGKIIELIGACIAGSAYYLLLILNMATPKITSKQRAYALLFSFGSFLVVNIIRIIILSTLVVNDSKFFEVTHALFWYGLSTIFVIVIWFAEVKIFDIDEVPLYSDLKFLYGLSRKGSK